MNAAAKSFLRPVAITVAGIVVTLSVLFAAWMLFLVAVFFGNFHFHKSSHIGIFFETCLFIASAIFAGFSFLRGRTARSYALVIGSAGLAVLTFWLWSIPAARGLVH